MPFFYATPGNGQNSDSPLAGHDDGPLCPGAVTPFTGSSCNSIRIALKGRGSLDSVGLGVEILCALQRLHPGVFQLEPALHMVGSRTVIRAIAQGLPAESIVAAWQPQLEEFHRRRAPYLLY